MQGPGSQAVPGLAGSELPGEDLEALRHSPQSVEPTPPSLQKAEEHREAVHPRGPDGKPWAWREMTPERIGPAFGTGVGLYFYTLRWLIAICLLMFLLAIPMMVIGGLTDPAKAICTLGSFAPKDNKCSQVPSDWQDSFLSGGNLLSRNGVLMAVASLDLLAVLVFMAGTGFIAKRTRKLVREIDLGALELADYSIMVSQLPQDATEKELKAYFNDTLGLGPVHDVVVVPKIEEVLGQLRAKAKLARAAREVQAQLALAELTDKQRQRCEAKLASLGTMMDELDKKVEAGKLKGLDAKEAVRAVVTFENENSMLDAVQKYCPKRKLRQQRVRKEHLFRGTINLVAIPAAPPTDWLYEHLATGIWGKVWRRVTAGGAVALLLLISFAVALALAVGQQKADVGSGARVGLKAASVVTTVVVNLLIGILLSHLVRFQRHETRTASERALTFSTATSWILNTGVLPMVANANIRGLQKMFGDTLFTRGYPDFTQAWYRNVGYQITVTVVINIAVKRTLASKAYLIGPLKRWWKLGRKKKSVYTQESMNELLEGPPFLLSDKYSTLMLYLGIALLLGCGVPLLYLLAIGSFLIAYFADKHRLLHLCKLPARYSEAMTIGLLEVMPIFAVLHLVMAGWQMSYFRWEGSDYTMQAALEAETLCAANGNSADAVFSNELYVNSGERYDLDRLWAPHVLILLIPAAVLAFLKLLDATVGNTLEAVASFVGFKSKHLDWIAPAAPKKEHLPPLSKALIDGPWIGPKTYRLEQDPRYAEAVKCFDPALPDEPAGGSKVSDLEPLAAGASKSSILKVERQDSSSSGSSRSSGSVAEV